MHKPLRVLQLIDSLEPGGSEKMAVQLANRLSTIADLSALACTRKSGALNNELSKGVLSFKANKKNLLDIKAFLRLRAFIKSNNITIIHAHSTSFFWATLIKWSLRDIKLIWHDHYGNRSQTTSRNNKILFIFSFFFNQIVSVNEDLKNWSLRHLNCRYVDYLPNFSLNYSEKNSVTSVKLKGDAELFKIVHVANLRPEKDHLTALRAVNLVLQQETKISYHIIGQYDSESSYYQLIISFINENALSENVFIYGSHSQIPSILKQADLGILSSTFEGLPVSLLEYINADLPVLVTDVGKCKNIVGQLGQVIEPGDEARIANAILKIIENIEDARYNANKLKQVTSKIYDSEKIIEQLIDIYNLSLQTSK